MTTLTNRFSQALDYAAELHKTQYRKGTEIPYLSHLLAVCALVLEAGGDEDQAIAALLHDAVEDQGGAPTLDEIRHRFGDKVAEIVAGCTDAWVVPKPPWRERKLAYFEHLTNAPATTLLISLADKLHNARAVLADYRVLGEVLWPRFTGGREGTLWYYKELDRIFTVRDEFPALTARFREVVGQLESEAALR